MTLRTILFICAAVCFGLLAFNFGTASVQLGWLGAMFAAAGMAA